MCGLFWQLPNKRGNRLPTSNPRCTGKALYRSPLNKSLQFYLAHSQHLQHSCQSEAPAFLELTFCLPSWCPPVHRRNPRLSINPLFKSQVSSPPQETFPDYPHLLLVACVLFLTTTVVPGGGNISLDGGSQNFLEKVLKENLFNILI